MPNTNIATAPSSRIRIALSNQDTQHFEEAMSASTWKVLETEQFKQDLYLDEVIPKPWGLEFRVYCDTFFDVWKLTILPGKSTSTHCHPRKETALLCLSGTGKISFFNQESHMVSAGDVVFIPKGVFHNTENLGNSTLELVEVETPRNKFDLVRLSDRYGRSGTSYEQEVMDCELMGMRSLSYIAEAKLRTVCHQKQFRFGVKGALELICRETPGLMFVVPLSLKCAFLHNIQVHKTVDPAQLDESVFYLTICKN
ncbi:MAG: cupin domain-containing protein (plasmid) [Microcoleus anatoxicus]|uniref:cupin domain-containing protein n=1 Tax=Microcoleus anatoxicus TaxID=2705319 RepID=UPI003671AAC0